MTFAELFRFVKNNRFDECFPTLRFRGVPASKIDEKLFNFEEKTLSTSKCIFPYYQGESTIFVKGNFLYHTPDLNNLLNLRELNFHTLLLVGQKR